jgi:hypothetical protein
MILLMLVEDHAAFRDSLALLLGREPDLEVVVRAGSLAEARGALGGSFDVAVVDLGLCLTHETCCNYHAMIGERKVLALPRVSKTKKEAPREKASAPAQPSSSMAGAGVPEVSQAEDRHTETAARIVELERIKTSLEKALGHAQKAYPPRGARRIELLIHAALRETDVQIQNLMSLP